MVCSDPRAVAAAAECGLVKLTVSVQARDPGFQRAQDWLEPQAIMPPPKGSTNAGKEEPKEDGMGGGANGASTQARLWAASSKLLAVGSGNE